MPEVDSIDVEMKYKVTQGVDFLVTKPLSKNEIRYMLFLRFPIF